MHAVEAGVENNWKQTNTRKKWHYVREFFFHTKQCVVCSFNCDSGWWQSAHVHTNSLQSVPVFILLTMSEWERFWNIQSTFAIEIRIWLNEEPKKNHGSTILYTTEWNTHNFKAKTKNIFQFYRTQKKHIQKQGHCLSHIIVCAQ